DLTSNSVRKSQQPSALALLPCALVAGLRRGTPPQLPRMYFLGPCPEPRRFPQRDPRMSADPRPGHKPPARPCRLWLECLEDRALPSTFMVNTTLDEVIPGNGKLSLREAITAANTHPGADTIILPAGVFKITIPGTGDDANLSGDFDITGSLTIQGAGPG